MLPGDQDLTEEPHDDPLFLQDSGLSAYEVEHLIERTDGLRHKPGKVLGVPLRDADLLPYRQVLIHSKDNLWCVVINGRLTPLILL